MWIRESATRAPRGPTWIRPVLLGVLGLALSCAPRISTWVDYDGATDFSAFRTYDWIPPGEERDVLEGPEGTIVRTAIDAELARAGLRQTSDAPDLFVTYHVAQVDTFRVGRWGYADGASDVAVHAFEKGTLVVDLADAGDGIVWRGAAEAILNHESTGNEDRQLVHDAVRQIFREYPADAAGQRAEDR